MKTLRAMLVRFAGLFRRKQLDAEMADELQAHLEALMERNIAAGMSPEEARFAALRSFGGVTQIQERARDERRSAWVEHLLQDLRYALRQLRKTPGFTAVVVFSLAIGIGANTAVFSVVNDHLLKLMPVSNPGELVLFQWVAGPQGRDGSDGGDAGPDNLDRATGRRTRRVFSLRMFEAFRHDSAALSEVFAVAPLWGLNVNVDGHSEMGGLSELVSGNYHEALGVRAWRGRTLLPDDDRPDAAAVAVISYRYWQTRFSSDPAAVGKSILVNLTPVTIVGITPPEFPGMVSSGGWTDLALPLALAPQVRYDAADLEKPSHWWVRILGRLKPGATIEQARASLEGRFQAAARESMRRAVEPPRLLAVPGGYARMEAHREAELKPLKITAGIALLVLLAACTNVANLLLARGAARRRELAVRLALGAGRGRLVRQLMTESVLLALLGAGLGLLVGAWGLELLSLPMIGGKMPPLDLRVAGFTVALALLTGAGFGLAPALRATRLDLNTEFQGGARLSGHRSRLGQALLVTQVALSLVLLTGAGLFVRTVRNLRSVDVGFNRTHLLMFALDGTIAGYKNTQTEALYEDIAARVSALPGVRSVTFAAWSLLSSASGFVCDLSVPGRPAPPGGSDVTYQPVAPGFFESYEIPLVTGRTIDASDRRTAPQVAVINQALARKFFGDENPIGRRVDGGGGNREIVGVVRDVKHQDLRTPIAPILYVPLAQRDGGAVYFTVRTMGEPAAMTAAVRGVVHEIDRNLPLFDVRTMDETVEANLLSGEKSFAQMSVCLGGLALALVCVGLHGLMSYSVQRRTNEIGIRMALGALPRWVAWMILRESLTLILIGVLAGIAGALAATRLIAQMLYDVPSSDPLIYASVALLLVAVGSLACFLPARRAAKIDPMVALRAE